MAFKRLVRFAIGDRVSYGDLLSVNGSTYNVRRLAGDPFNKLQTTEDIVQVEKVSPAFIGSYQAGCAWFTFSLFFFFFFTKVLPASLSHRAYSNYNARGFELPESRKGS